MPSKAKTVAEYLASLPADRREAIAAVRTTILANLDRGIEEGMSYGMIGYHVPHAVFPAGYHCDPKQPLPYAGLASQSGHMSLYLMGVYFDPADARWLADAWKKTGKKLDMGKSCIRFKKLADVPLDVVGAAIRRMPLAKYVAMYEAQLAQMGKGRSAKAAKAASKQAATTTAAAAAKAAGKKAVAKKAPAKKLAAKKA
jgi:uncharacterized protein YdhG (YjbR/CyaY superfamily)